MLTKTEKIKEMNNKRIVSTCLAILLTGLIYFPMQAQQKNGTHRPDFTGEWKSRESISMGGNIVCCYNPGDRMLAKTMKIAEQANFLTIEVSSSFPGATPVTSQEKLAFNGEASEVNLGQGKGKKSTVKFSADGQTMTVNSIVQLMVAAPYRVDVQEQLIVYVTEVWKLSNDGKSISVQASAKSNSFDAERSWKTVFDKSR